MTAKDPARDLAHRLANEMGVNLHEGCDNSCTHQHEMSGAVEDVAKLIREYGAACAERERKKADLQINALLNHCGDYECSDCAVIVCPRKEPLHFHHDGCPACYFDDCRAQAKAPGDGDEG